MPTQRKNGFFGKKREEVRRLLNLDQNGFLTDDEFKKRADEQKRDLVSWWKRHYGYSKNDPRYLTATITQMEDDRLEYILALYNATTGKDRYMETLLRKKASNPKQFYKKHNDEFKAQMKKLFE